MIHPTVSLWRHTCRVTFYEQGNAGGLFLPNGAGAQWHASMAGVRRGFHSMADARGYVSFWLGDAGARTDLLWLLKRSGSNSAGVRPGTDDWLDILAGRLFSGDVIVMEETARLAMPGRLMVDPGASTSLAGSLSTLPPLSQVPSLAPPPPLLPSLEEVQIEAADVMPEVKQTLEQVDLAKKSVEVTMASLGTTTASVSDIQAAIEAARTSVSSTLGSV